MGIAGIGVWQVLIILVIVLVVFGGKRLRSLGGDLGSSVKGFRDALTSAETTADEIVRQPKDAGVEKDALAVQTKLTSVE